MLIRTQRSSTSIDGGGHTVCLAFQEFEKKEHKLKARAATNLAFLYSLEGDSANAERYADLAIGTDKYSAQALVNKVSCSMCLSVLPLEAKEFRLKESWDAILRMGLGFLHPVRMLKT